MGRGTELAEPPANKSGESRCILPSSEIKSLQIKSTITFILATTIASLCPGQTPCDSELVRQANPNDRDRYSQREKDRCEGVYLQQVSGTIGELLVVSLTTAGARLAQWPSNGALPLRWNFFAASSEVHIQAFPIVPRKHFRMDVVRGAVESPVESYDWNTNLVAKYLAPSEAGLVSWTLAQINGRRQRVYLPMAVGTSAVPKGPYRLTLVPPTDLSEVYLTVAGIAPGEKPLRTHTPLKFGSYPANQKIEVDLPPLPKAGLYRVELEGDRKDQGSVATPPFLINHSQ